MHCDLNFARFGLLMIVSLLIRGLGLRVEGMGRLIDGYVDSISNLRLSDLGKVNQRVSEIDLGFEESADLSILL